MSFLPWNFIQLQTENCTLSNNDISYMSYDTFAISNPTAASGQSQHTLSNIEPKPNLPFTLQGPCHQEKPHVTPLGRAYFCAQGKAALEDPLGPQHLLGYRDGLGESTSRGLTSSSPEICICARSAFVIGSHGTSKTFREFAILQASLGLIGWWQEQSPKLK